MNVLERIDAQINNLRNDGFTPTSIVMNDKDVAQLVEKLSQMGECATIFNFKKKTEKIFGIKVVFDNDRALFVDGYKKIVDSVEFSPDIILPSEEIHLNNAYVHCSGVSIEGSYK